jgi:hypothetical protein
MLEHVMFRPVTTATSFCPGLEGGLVGDVVAGKQCIRRRSCMYSCTEHVPKSSFLISLAELVAAARPRHVLFEVSHAAMTAMQAQCACKTARELLIVCPANRES